MARIETLAENLQQHFAALIETSSVAHGELTIEVAAEHLLELGHELRAHAEFDFQLLVDVCGIDYSAYGKDEWETADASNLGFSRAPEELQSTVNVNFPKRFAVVYHLLSISQNQRLRIRVFAQDNDMPRVPSVMGVWNSANWFEREAFDLYGILFEGHPDLRRLLTDYGFIGHPFRKDFPLSGHVEMRYDPERKRVVYEPVSIEPRVLVPKVIRHDHRYQIGVKKHKDTDSNA